jgi:hypothetical protein
MNSFGQGHVGRLRRLCAAARRHRVAGLALSAIALAGAAPSAVASPATPPDDGAYVTDGPVHAVARAGGRTFVGGEFSRVGPRSGSGALLAAAGAWQRIPAEVGGGDVEAVVSDGAGGWYVGGTFTSVGGQPRQGLARVKADGTVDSEFNPSVLDAQNRPAAVYALALGKAGERDAGTLYVGGEFAKVVISRTISSRTNIAALDVATRRADGSLALKVQELPLATKCSAFPQCSPAVRSLALSYPPTTVGGAPSPQPVLFIGGSFDLIGQAADATQAALGIAAAWGFNAVDGGGNPIPGELVVDTAATPTLWAPEFSAGSPDRVEALAPSAPVLSTTPGCQACPTIVVYAGGRWRNSSGVRAPIADAFQFRLSATANRTVTGDGRFGRWLPAPSSPAAAPCASSCGVEAMLVSGSTVYFGGDFKQAGTVNAPWLAQIPVVPVPGHDQPNNTPCPLANSPSASRCTPTTIASSGGPNLGAPVRALAIQPNGSTLYAAGEFGRGVAAVATSNGAVTPSFSPNPDGPVSALAIDPSGSSLYAGGEFRSLESVARAGLAAFDSAGKLIDSWAPNAGASARVHALAASDSTVYAGGQFPGLAGGGQTPTLLALGAASGATAPFVANPQYEPPPAGDPDAIVRTPDVLSLSLLGSTLYVGGAFDRVGGQPRSNLAAVDATTGSPSSWNPHVTGGFVYSILPACGAVYVGGGFSHVGGQAREFLVAVDPVSGAPTSWNPVVNGIPVGGEVLALARSGPTIYAGGNFATIGGQARQHVAALDATTGRALEGFNPGANGPVESLAVTDSAVYLGGTFDIAGNERRLHLAAVDPASGALSGWDPSPDGPVVALTAGDGGLYAGGFFESVGATGQRGFAPFGSGAGSPFVSSECSRPTTSFDGSSAPASGGTLSSGSTGTSRSGATGGGIAARIERLAVTPALVRLSGRPIEIRFRLSRASAVRLNFERQRRVACPRRTARRRSGPCLAYRPFASMTRRGRSGTNRVTLPRHRIGRRRLAPGRYRVRVVPIPAGRGATVARAHFTVRR